MTPTSCHDHMKLGDHDYKLQLFNQKTQPSSSTISTHVLSYSSMQDQGSYYPREAHHLKYQQEANNFALEGGSSNNHGVKSCLWKNDTEQGNQIRGRHHQTIPTKWLPTKLRLVRKMMGSDRTATEAPIDPPIKFEDYHKLGSSSPMETTENSSNVSFSTPIRVCSDCNTTKTPLWRSGPRGPKSLCNACGIRQRKARRALAAAMAAANGTTVAAEGSLPSKPTVQQKDKRLKTNSQIAPCKKKSKPSNNNGRKNKLCFEDFLISLSKNLAFHQVFPQDEKEAAILLMALSCGLVHG